MATGSRSAGWGIAPYFVVDVVVASAPLPLSQHAGGGPMHPNRLSDPEGEACEDCNGYRLCFGRDTEG